MFERFTDRARGVVVRAQAEARLLNHNYIGTEHILLGLIHEDEGVGAHVLATMGIELDAVRREVEAIVGHGVQTPRGHIRFAPRSKKALELSLREAQQLHHDYVGTGHLLLGLLREGEGVAATVLVKLGADLVRMREAVSRHSAQDDAGLRSTAPPPQSGIEPARCGFCGIPSPECGPLFTGVSGALICSACARIAAGPTRGLANVRETLDIKAARYHAMGPPPDDVDAARDAIAHAFEHLMDVSDDGTTLINVEDGRELKPYADEIRGRVGWFLAERVNVVERVKFLDETHAVVWWKLQLTNGRPVVWDVYHEGRAVLDEGRWKVARETVCQRWAEAGVHCPPRSGT